jgi:hypothetical protein
MADKNKGAPPVWVKEGVSVRVAYDLGTSEIVLKVGDCFKVEVFQGESDPAIHRLTGFSETLGKRVGPAQIKYQEWDGVDWGEEQSRANFWYCDSVTKTECFTNGTGSLKKNKKNKKNISQRKKKTRNKSRSRTQSSQ